MENREIMFAPYQIGNMELKNRFATASHGPPEAWEMSRVVLTSAELITTPQEPEEVWGSFSPALHLWTMRWRSMVCPIVQAPHLTACSLSAPPGSLQNEYTPIMQRLFSRCPAGLDV